ncbi:hypothetical protein [Streptomyces tsukubensis]|uniref:Integral membrane protein n=1 Tax=Streptomyces tsukubensis TaxID=83656 RepID=A0A1V4A1Q4_9ACTN|nr:hypothetical protein [Streptomyces tsukubensis]OON72422.1 hypothetical protein B1H18_29765 [Streptomyces tsukubensis]QFR96951.1 hypothetical protein GBW32_32790 [Streptomyces tsukubensis]
MAGTDERASADEEALYVLTAVLLTPAQFPSVLGDDYPEACRALELAPIADGYGLVLGQDGTGARWTVVVDDVALVAVAIASWDCGMEYDLSPGASTVVAGLPGWPLALAVTAPGVPAPYDPAPESEDRPPLTPPAGDVWGPAQRRLGADEVALQWSVWREQIDDEEFTPTAGGQTGPSDGEGHAGLRRVLAEAHAYVETPPPPGRIRSTFAHARARTLRVDGPGWSMIARTDDIAFVLLDDEPGEVLPVGRGPELPGLLKALDHVAVRPS